MRNCQGTTALSVHNGGGCNGCGTLLPDSFSTTFRVGGDPPCEECNTSETVHFVVGCRWSTFGGQTNCGRLLEYRACGDGGYWLGTAFAPGKDHIWGCDFQFKKRDPSGCNPAGGYAFYACGPASCEFESGCDCRDRGLKSGASFRVG